MGAEFYAELAGVARVPCRSGHARAPEPALSCRGVGNRRGLTGTRTRARMVPRRGGQALPGSRNSGPTW